MKKILLLTFVTLAGLSITSQAQSIRGFFDHEKLNGNVVEVRYLRCISARYPAVDTSISCIIYNNKGEATRQTVVKHYDKRFNNTEAMKLDTFHNDLFKYGRIFTYQYNKEQKLQTVTSISNKSKTVYRYNGKGEITKSDDYDKDGKCNFETSYSYDRAGNMVKVKMWEVKPSAKFEREYDYKYDTEGRMIEQLEYMADGSLNLNYNYEYTAQDKMGNWTTCIQREKKKNEKTILYRQISYAD